MNLWRHADFRRFWVGQAVSQFGTAMTRVALPMVAVLALHADALAMGLLVATGSLGSFLTGLVTGVWVDRLPRRAVLIVVDVLRALVLASIPLAALLGALSLAQLFVVAFVTAVLSAFFQAAYHAYLPGLVGREHLVEGNSKLEASEGVAWIGGSALAGALVQTVTAPLAILADALSYLVSAGSLVLIRTREAARVVTARRSTSRDIAEGLRFVRRHPLLRPMFARDLVGRFSGSFFATIYTLYALEELRISPILLGVAIALGGAGALAGAVVAGRVIRQVGIGRTVVAAHLAEVLVYLPLPFAAGPPLVAASFLFFQQLLGDGLAVVWLIGATSIRQSVTPDALLGRVNSVRHVIVEGIAPVGALVAALLAEAFGMRATVLVAVLGGLAASAILWFSPLRELGPRHEPLAVVEATA